VPTEPHSTAARRPPAVSSVQVVEHGPLSALLASRRVQGFLVAAFLIWSVVTSEVSPAALVSPSALDALGRLLRGLVPPDLSPGFLAVVAEAVARTLAIGIAGTMLAVVLAIPLGILATPTLFRPGALAAGRGRWTVALFAAHLAARTVLRVFRAV